MNIGDAIDESLLNRPLVISGTATTTLAGFLGKWLVLYFYPKDNTSGCTTEGLDFNARLSKFKRQNANIVGVSRDSLASHDRFREMQGFEFPLISDPDEVLCRTFDVIQEKNMYGRKVLGIQRSTFLLDGDGRLAEAWRNVKVPGHADTVLETLKTLNKH